MSDKFNLVSINVSYGSFELFKNFNIEFDYNSINVLLGPSGCGKTTLLNIISSKLEEKSFVFQEPRLLEWYDVYNNIDFVLRDKISNKADRSNIIKDSLISVGLIDNIRSKPNELSGGMKQRLSLARAFAYDAPFILMDEPLQGQDIKKKKELLDIILYMQKKTLKTIFYVTHDVSEAVIVGDNIFVLSSSPNTKVLYNEIIKCSEKDITSNFFMKLQATLTEYLLY